MSRDSGVKKGGAARKALDALDKKADTRIAPGKPVLPAAKPKTAQKERGEIGDGFVGTAGREERGDGHVTQSRHAADNQRTHDEGTALTREDVIRLLREQNMENALPPAPPKPGWHRCWLSTTNKNDTISMRQRLGYRPVDQEDVRGFDEAKVHSGEYAGMVVVNEMILFEVPEDIYQAIMKYQHHDKPNEEASRITDAIEEIEQTVGRKLVQKPSEDDDVGFDQLREEQTRRAPTFQ